MDALRWGLIGSGDIVRKRVAPALRDLTSCELLAVSRARAELAEAFAQEVGARKWYAGWQDLLLDGDIDAVYIATPVYLHAVQSVAAAEAGKHVLCEKPMAVNVGECERVIAACRANRVKLGIAYYRRFYPALKRIKAILAAGELGEVVFVQINAFEWFDPPPDHPRRWLLNREQAGGGPMFDFGCHRLELLIHLCGRVRRVVGMVANAAFNREVEDTAAALLQFKRGACATLAVTHAAFEPQDTLAVFCSRGSLHVAELNKGEVKIKRAGAAENVELHPPAANLHQPLIADFVDAVLTGREPEVNGETGREVAGLEARIYAGVPRPG
jgi:predicted dehydrogenase